MEYTKIATATERDVNKYLEKGWKLIDTTRSSYDGSGNDTSITYHLGYPVENHISDLLSIIRSYEENGFKEKLFFKWAEDSGINLDDYSKNGGIGWGNDHPTLEAIAKYEKVVNNKEVTYYATRSEKSDIEF
ncbi:hypothetical protein NY607_12440 [Lysinibacillus sp. A4]|uniref:hypothetical protein n=1 Tax=Lysinibacillus sp. A4 TaxID=2976269 RepID=UPI00217619A2|nr:hypothetical protein [Lysinibacillus sp. A4]MCS5501935.1 hypothetical protein [Lysinibacillus sp. A4]